MLFLRCVCHMPQHLGATEVLQQERHPCLCCSPYGVSHKRQVTWSFSWGDSSEALLASMKRPVAHQKLSCCLISGKGRTKRKAGAALR
jgi:hypothetical protein